MRIRRLIFLIVVVLTIQSCKNGDRSNHGLDPVPDPCPIEDDIVRRNTLITDSSENDFSDLVNFIEAKGELSRLDRLKRLDSTDGNFLFLSKLLCPDEGESSAIEKWFYDGVYSFRIKLSSIKPIPEEKHLDFTIYLTQYNFANVEDMHRVMAVLLQSGIGWGDVRMKWREYSLVDGENRIYIIQSAFAHSQEMQVRYAEIIEKEWLKK